nr:unnamed protein product [Spirometra erinaceieuropaei]
MNAPWGSKDTTSAGRWRLLANYIKGNSSQSAGLPSTDVYRLFVIKCVSSKLNDDCRRQCLELRFVELSENGTFSPAPPLLILPAPTFTVGENGDQNCLSERLRRLVGFDSTGLVCLWPSELLMAHIFLNPVAVYARLWDAIATATSRRTWQRVCELGAGMTAAAGLAIARRRSNFPQSDDPFSGLELVVLTDGNEDCVATIQQSVQLQGFSRGQTELPTLEVGKLRWSSSEARPLSGDLNHLGYNTLSSPEKARQPTVPMWTVSARIAEKNPANRNTSSLPG